MNEKKEFISINAINNLLLNYYFDFPTIEKITVALSSMKELRSELLQEMFSKLRVISAVNSVVFLPDDHSDEKTRRIVTKMDINPLSGRQRLWDKLKLEAKNTLSLKTRDFPENQRKSMLESASKRNFDVKEPTFSDDEKYIYQEGLIGLNMTKLREDCLYFSATFAVFAWETPSIAGDCCVALKTPVIISEFVTPSETLYSSINGMSKQVFIRTFYQLLLGLGLAHKKYKFTHYDLHPSNVRLKKLPAQLFLLVKHPYDEEDILILTDNHPVIIDYGYSYVEIEEAEKKTYGRAGIEGAGVLSNKSFPAFDTYKILMGCGLAAMTYKNQEVLDTVAEIVDTFFYPHLEKGKYLTAREELKIKSTDKFKTYYALHDTKELLALTHEQLITFVENKYWSVVSSFKFELASSTAQRYAEQVLTCDVKRAARIAGTGLGIVTPPTLPIYRNPGEPETLLIAYLTGEKIEEKQKIVLTYINQRRTLELVTSIISSLPKQEDIARIIDCLSDNKVNSPDSISTLLSYVSMAVRILYQFKELYILTEAEESIGYVRPGEVRYPWYTLYTVMLKMSSSLQWIADPKITKILENSGSDLKFFIIYFISWQSLKGYNMSKTQRKMLLGTTDPVTGQDRPLIVDARIPWYACDPGSEATAFSTNEMFAVGAPKDISVIGDGHCLLHASLRACYKPYTDEKTTSGRQRLAKAFRNDLAIIIEMNFDYLDKIFSYTNSGWPKDNLVAHVRSDAFLGDEILGILACILGGGIKIHILIAYSDGSYQFATTINPIALDIKEPAIPPPSATPGNLVILQTLNHFENLAIVRKSPITDKIQLVYIFADDDPFIKAIYEEAMSHTKKVGFVASRVEAIERKKI